MVVAFLSAWRALRAAPWTTGAAIVTLALGAGASTAVFAIANGVLLRPLVYASPDRLVLISAVRRVDGTDLGTPLDRVPEWRSRLRAVQDLAAYSTGEFTIRGVGDPVIAQAAIVSREFFRVMGSPARQGRWPGGTVGVPEAVVSHAFATRWGSGVSPIGKQMTIGSTVFTVTAVAGGGFAFPSERAEVWLPVDAVPDLQVFGRPNARPYRLVARLVDGVSVEQARADVTRVVGELFPSANAMDGSVRELREAVVGASRPIVFAFAAAATLLFLVACANAATLLVGRAVARQREFAVRLALGAGRGQLIRAAFVESLLLAAAATIAGIGLAQLILATFRDAIGTQVPRIASVTIDLPVLLAAAGAAVIVTIICGTAPTIGAGRGRELGVFRQGASTTHRSGRRVRDALVVIQIAMAVVLLVGAGLLGRTVWTLFSTDIGADRDRALVARLSLTETTRFDASSRGDFVRRLLADVRSLPGVEAAGLGSNLPPRVNQLEFSVRILNEERGQDETVGLSLVSVTPGYFEALGVPMLRGREFAEADEISGQPVAVMTARFARQLSPQSDPLDTVLNLALPRASGGRVKPRLVGMARDVRFRGLESPALGAVYVPWSQLPTGVSYLVVRSAGDPAALAPAIARVIRTLDPTMPVPQIRTLTEEVAEAVEVRTLRLALVGGLAILAFVVAAGGLCGALVRDVV
ncbi:MAG TPA: ABC transporter permease, partial [Vicinamibacterales bacterium]|nr:ABC transporter permease [Vicinamibacterales bacterium]